MSAPDVAVVIPTLRRLDSLTRALRSVFDQQGVEARLREIVVVDNDPEASSRQTVEALRAASPVPVIWVHAPRPGVATARNAGLAATDDDCVYLFHCLSRPFCGALPRTGRGDGGEFGENLSRTPSSSGTRRRSFNVACEQFSLQA